MQHQLYLLWPIAIILMKQLFYSFNNIKYETYVTESFTSGWDLKLNSIES